MIQYSEAIQIILNVAQNHSQKILNLVETLPIEKAVGRILARDVFAKDAIPSFDNSAMDGFAVCSEFLAAASPSKPMVLPVTRMIAAGDGIFDELNKSVACEIMTGAPFPIGALDSVIKIEEVTVNRDSQGNALTVQINQPVKNGEYIRKKGADFKGNEKVLDAHKVLLPEFTLALSSLGNTEVSVFKKLKIALISTGRELVDASEPELRPGMIRNSTAVFLKSALPEYSVDFEFLGNIPDEENVFRAKLQSVLSEDFDIILTTGAVSMGQYDFVPKVLAELGAQTHFHKVAIRPGRPIFFAELKSKFNQPVAFFGFPGNPVSTAVGLRFFLSVYLRERMKQAPEKYFRARLTQSVENPGGIRCFFKARTDFFELETKTQITEGQASFQAAPLLQANSWAILAEDLDYIAAGTEVWVAPLQPIESFFNYSAFHSEMFQESEGCCS